MKRIVSFVACLIALVALSPAHAADDPRAKGPTGLILTYHVAPADRTAFHQLMQTDGVARLEALRAQHTIAHYRVLWSRYADDKAGWDMMVVLDLDTPAGIAGWRAVEDKTPGGLPEKALPLVTQIETAPIDIMRNASTPSSDVPVYLVVPYDYLVGVNDYIHYVEGYVVPQMDGWMQEGALKSYDFLLSRYPAGRPWTAMLLLAYRNDMWLGQRDAVVKKVRARLANDPAWKAFADNKQNIREEGAPVIADVLAAR